MMFDSGFFYFYFNEVKIVTESKFKETLIIFPKIIVKVKMLHNAQVDETRTF